MDKPGWQRNRRVRVTIITVLFLAQFVALLWLGTYATESPTFYGIPFFYWYTILWLIIGAISMGVAFALLGQGGQPGSVAAPGDESTPTAPGGAS